MNKKITLTVGANLANLVKCDCTYASLFCQNYDKGLCKLKVDLFKNIEKTT